MTRLGEFPPAGMRMMRAVVRSETSASPSGRNAIPHGTDKPVATVRRAGGVAVGEGDAGAVGVAPSGVSLGVAGAGGVVALAVGAAGSRAPDEPHPATNSAARIARRRI